MCWRWHAVGDTGEGRSQQPLGVLSRPLGDVSRHRLGLPPNSNVELSPTPPPLARSSLRSVMAPLRVGAGVPWDRSMVARPAVRVQHVVCAPFRDFLNTSSTVVDRARPHSCHQGMDRNPLLLDSDAPVVSCEASQNQYVCRRRATGEKRLPLCVSACAPNRGL